MVQRHNKQSLSFKTSVALVLPISRSVGILGLIWRHSTEEAECSPRKMYSGPTGYRRPNSGSSRTELICTRVDQPLGQVRGCSHSFS